MKSMQRKFGTFGKRSENEADVQSVLEEFQAVDKMLDFMLHELKAWRNGWEDMLKLQYNISEGLVNLYKPIEPTTDPDMRRQPAQTPAKYMQKCLGLQKEYSDMKDDLAQEIVMINSKLVRPVEEAKKNTKMLHKTMKHRENMKLDYERYTGTTEKAQKKEVRSQREEAALAAHEDKLVQARIDYQTADEQVKQTFPPVSAAVMKLLPYILANMIMVQTTLVGQLYTVVDAYTKKFGMPNPAPSDAEIVALWDNEFTILRRELENGLTTIANGKAVNMSMQLVPEKDRSTVTGLGLRNKVMQRGKNPGAVPMPASASSRNDSSIEGFSDSAYAEDEAAPPKPPRPGTTPSPGPNIMSNARIPTASSFSPPTPSNGFYGQKPTSPYSTKGIPGRVLPYADPSTLAAAAHIGTPPSQYLTPTNGNSPQPSSHSSTGPGGNGSDYFSNASNNMRRTSQASTASSLATAAVAAAAKKKPPPPVPAKRIPSTPGPQFVTALYDFEGQNPGDLAFREGDRIRVVRKTDSTDDWWEGELRGSTGSFPANYVQT